MASIFSAILVGDRHISREQDLPFHSARHCTYGRERYLDGMVFICCCAGEGMIRQDNCRFPSFLMFIVRYEIKKKSRMIVFKLLKAALIGTHKATRKRTPGVVHFLGVPRKCFRNSEIDIVALVTDSSLTRGIFCFVLLLRTQFLQDIYKTAIFP